MKKLNIKIILSAVILTCLSGCTAFQFEQYQKGSEAVGERITETTDQFKYKKVRQLAAPPISPTKIEEVEVIDWLDNQVSQKSKDFTLSIIINQIMKNTGVKIDYDYDVDPNKRISFNFEGTTEAALKMLSIQADVFILKTANKITVQKYIVKTFTLPAIHGSSGYQLGSASAGTSSNEDALEGAVSSTGAGDGQFTQFYAQDTNYTRDVFGGIKAILHKEGGDEDEVVGSVQQLQGLSSIVVRTTPALMEKVEAFVKNAVTEMTKQVILDIEVIEFQQTEGSEFGLDGVLNASIGGSSLALTGSSTQITDSSNTGLSFLGGGSLEGSDALIRYLKQYGTVSITTRQTVRAQNQQVQEVDLSDVRSYIAKTTVEYDDDDDASVDMEIGTVRDGVKMIVAASVYEDNVYLRLNGTLIKFVYFDTQEIGDVTVSNPRTRQSRFNVGGKFEYNRPVLVTSMKQTVEQSQNDHVLEVISSNSGEKKVVNTLVIVTPRLNMEYSK